MDGLLQASSSSLFLSLWQKFALHIQLQEAYTFGHTNLLEGNGVLLHLGLQDGSTLWGRCDSGELDIVYIVCMCCWILRSLYDFLNIKVM